RRHDSNDYRRNVGRLMHEEIKRARDILARRKEIEAEFAADNARRDLTFTPLRREPPLSRTTTMTHETNEPDFSGWEKWLQSHLENFADMLGREIGETDKAINARLSELEERVGQLVAEREVVERAAKNGTVVELPDFLRRKHNAA